MSGRVPITSAFSQSVPCSVFCVYKREGSFLIYSQIILVMAQICNKSHQWYLEVSALRVNVLERPPGTPCIRASLGEARKSSSTRDVHQNHLKHPLPVFGSHCHPRSPTTVSQAEAVPWSHPLTFRAWPGRPGDASRQREQHLKHLPPGLAPFHRTAPSSQLLRSERRTSAARSPRPTHPCTAAPSSASG